VLEALQAFGSELALFTRALEAEDGAALLAAFERARRAREELVPE
jgi:hypothetical protein